MLHIAIYAWVLFAAWRWADFKNWKHYHTTMLYMSVSGLIYSLLANDQSFYLWRYPTTDVLSAELTDFIYCVLMYPLIVLLFLSRFPESTPRQFLRMLKFVVIFDVLEFIGLEFGAINHDHGWDMAWSTWFNAVTFCMLRIHHEAPLVAYILSAIVIAYLLFHFQVPLWDTI